MVVVFQDPYCRRFKIFDSQSPDHMSGHFIPFDGSFHDFVAELTLTGLARITSMMDLEILHPDRVLTPNVVLGAIEKVAQNCLKPDSCFIEGHETAILVSILMDLEKKYRASLSDLVTVVVASSFQKQFQELNDELVAISQQIVWSCQFRKGDGVQHLMIEGIGSGKHLHWPTTVEVCTLNNCETNQIRHQLRSVNLLYKQIQWVMKQLTYTGEWSDKPRRSKWFINYHFDRNHRYSSPWFYGPQSDVIRPLISWPRKTLSIWAEFEPDVNKA